MFHFVHFGSFPSTSTKIFIPCSNGEKICVAHALAMKKVPSKLKYFTEHQTTKNAGFALKQKDNKMANNVDTFVFTADTESLLLAPQNNANIMYFRTKLNIHNFTCYDLKTRDVMNYVWSEVHGDLEASIFTSFYIDYLTTIVERNTSCTKIIIWSDSLHSAIKQKSNKGGTKG